MMSSMTMLKFKDNGNGTVTDRKTGLMWAKGANHGRMSWVEAMTFCQVIKKAGYTDWRLPGRFELESLLDLDQYHPALPEGHPFENVQSACYWSSSALAYGTNYAWVVYMYYGNSGYDLKTYYGYVWPVRGGRDEV